MQLQSTRTDFPPMAYGMWNRYDFVLEALELAGPKSILEFGVGKGGLGARLAHMAERYVGVEPDDTSRLLATENVGSSGTIVESVDEIDASCFDLVCAFEVLEHIEDDGKALASWVDQVCDGGHVLLSVPAFSQRYSDFDRFAGHYRRYDPENLRSVFQDCGLDVRKQWLTGAPIGYLTEHLKVRAVRRKSCSGQELETHDDRTAASGRLFQPGKLSGAVMQYGSLPSRIIQRRFQTKGTGLVMLGQKRSNLPPPC